MGLRLLFQIWTSGALRMKRRLAKINGILRLKGRKTRDLLGELKGVPFVTNYKYLGVNVDRAIAMNDLVPVVKT